MIKCPKCGAVFEADEDEDGWYLKHAEKLATEIDDYQR